MRFIGLAALSLCLALGSCANLRNAYDAVTGTSVSPKAVIVAANAFNAVETTAKVYVSYCTPRPQPVGCADSAISQIIPAVRSGREARNSLEQFMTDHPGKLGPTGLYEALTSATATLSAISAQYNIKKVSTP